MIAAKARDITIIQCFAPAADKSEKEISMFYGELKRAITDTPKRNALVVTGDFDARVGADASEVNVLGRYGQGERNNLGETLVVFVPSTSW